jgi:hypothetical protein
MVTAQQQAEHQAAQTATLTMAVDELLDNLAGIENLSAERAAALARDVIADLAGVYGDEAASLNADWYDEMRAEVAATLAIEYAAQMAEPIPADDIQEDIGWALAPLFAPETGDVPDYESTIGRLAGKLQYFVGEMGRDTIAVSAAEDPVGTTYARHASANACAFCRLMATRGATYLSATTGEDGVQRVLVTGEIDPRTREVARGPRGSRSPGEKFHDHCKCIAVPQFPGDTLEPAPYVDQWMNDYRTAAAQAGGTRRADLSTILANMRENTGAR